MEPHVLICIWGRELGKPSDHGLEDRAGGRKTIVTPQNITDEQECEKRVGLWSDRMDCRCQWCRPVTPFSGAMLFGGPSSFTESKVLYIYCHISEFEKWDGSKYKKQTKNNGSFGEVCNAMMLFELDGLLPYPTHTFNNTLKYKQLLELSFCKWTVNFILAFSHGSACKHSSGGSILVKKPSH